MTTIQDAREKFECLICHSYFKNPVLTICGHKFCNDCLSNWLGKESGTCPLDYVALEEKDVFPDNYTKREINECLVFCENCRSKIQLLEFEQHKIRCAQGDNDSESSNCSHLEEIECEFKHVGCKYRVMTDAAKIEMDAHIKNNSDLHIKLLCDAFKNIKDLIDRCHRFCAHSEKCVDAGKGSLILDGAKLPYYLNDVYEKITVLDQSYKEHHIKLKGICETASTSRHHYPTFNDGRLAWNIDEFDRKVLLMSSDPTIDHFSPTFSTSSIGYRFCLRLKLSTVNCGALAIFIYMVKGEYDCALQWPFEGKICICIVHPSEPDLKIKSVMRTKPNSRAFQKPILSINSDGFGFPETTSISNLRDRGYVKNGKITILVSAQSFHDDF